MPYFAASVCCSRACAFAQHTREIKRRQLDGTRYVTLQCKTLGRVHEEYQARQADLAPIPARSGTLPTAAPGARRQHRRPTVSKENKTSACFGTRKAEIKLLKQRKQINLWLPLQGALLLLAQEEQGEVSTQADLLSPPLPRFETTGTRATSGFLYVTPEGKHKRFDF